MTHTLLSSGISVMPAKLHTPQPSLRNLKHTLSICRRAVHPALAAEPALGYSSPGFAPGSALEYLAARRLLRLPFAAVRRAGI